MRILIADDAEPFRLVLRKTIEAQAGWTVCGEAVDGVQAIEQAQRLKPDLIILDLNMPQANGVQAAHRISQLLPGVPILLNTHSDFELVYADAMKHGVSRVIAKSDPTALIATIKSFGEGVGARKIEPPSRG
jgi:DNA-binding NarL/FixJ family response regulator